MRFSRLPQYISIVIDSARRRVLEKQAKKNIQRNERLWSILTNYISQTNSGGASWSDYLTLYSYVRTHRPKEILECGTGVTTIVLAFALKENEEEHGIIGHLTSMEELSQYAKQAENLLPEELRKYVDIIQSPRIEDVWALYRGVRYKDVPVRPYELVFIDGPGTAAPSDGQKTFDFDFIRLVEKTSRPIFGIVDTRMSTCAVLHSVLREGVVHYDYARDLGFIGPCLPEDLLTTNEIIKKLGPHPI